MSNLSFSLIEALREDYRDGYGPSQTAKRHGISQQTSATHFSRFQREGVTRGTTRRPYGRGGPPAAFTGAPWIGVPITPPPVPIGPDWIGKPI